MEYGDGSGEVPSLGGSAGPKGVTLKLAGGMLYITASADVGMNRVQRGFNGRFLPDMQRYVSAANKRLAAELQQAMADQLEETRVRSEITTGRLKRALLDPRNARADQHGFAVGDVDYLDNSEAKYWRAIEQGTTHFVGKELKGVWGPTADGPYSPFGRRTKHETFIPMGLTYARQTLRAAGYDKDEIRVRGVIEEPIHPHRYMERAWEGFDMHVRSAQMVRDVIRLLHDNT